jgi:hypothetical protein
VIRSPAPLAVVATALALAGPAPADVDPTGEEMLFVYEVNRARSDPPGWAVEMGIDQMIGGDGNPADLVGLAPQPPLALNRTLVESARFKGQEMADNNYFSHQSQVQPDFLWPNDLVRNVFGYPLATQVPAAGGGFYVLPDDSNQIESIAGGYGPGTSDFGQALNAVLALIVDDGVPSLGHRRHLLATEEFNQSFVEAGAGFGFDGSSDYRNYWAFHTGVKAEPETYLTGVVFADGNGNDLYDAGEGLAGVTVAGGGANTTTDAAGGYSLLMGSGSHTVTCSGGGFSGTGSAAVVVAGANREVDCVSGFAGAYVDFIAVPEPVPDAAGAAALGALALLARRRPA